MKETCGILWDSDCQYVLLALSTSICERAKWPHQLSARHAARWTRLDDCSYTTEGKRRLNAGLTAMAIGLSFGRIVLSADQGGTWGTGAGKPDPASGRVREGVPTSVKSPLTNLPDASVTLVAETVTRSLLGDLLQASDAAGCPTIKYQIISAVHKLTHFGRGD